jgi:mannose-6-phosphate isomerase-like protein (cupin superfamily)
MATLQPIEVTDPGITPVSAQPSPLTAHLPTRQFDGSTGPRIIGPRDGKFVDLRSVGVRFMVWGAETGGTFSLVEHPIPPRTLVAPVHLHTREDEYSYVLEGRMGALLGDDVVYAEPGDLVFKPRNQWHTFWNAGDTTCRLLEIISPAGFEHFFNELGEQMIAAKAVSVRDVPSLRELGERYGHYFRPESIPQICQKYGLTYPG